MPWLVLLYPVFAHLGVWLHNLYLQWLALVSLLIVMLSKALIRRRVWAWITLVSSAAAAYFLTLRGGGIYALYVPPIAIPLGLLWIFARSLGQGMTPLVSRIAELVRGEPLPDVLRVYTRRVTQLWCVVASGLLISAISTAIWASPQMWSLITNVIHYVVIGATFIIELAYRRIKYAKLQPYGLTQYLRRLARVRITF